MKILSFLKLRLAALAPLAALATTITLSAVSGPAARLADSTSHGGVVLNGSPNVRIGGAPAARIGDTCSCPLNSGFPLFIPHVGGPISTGSTTVLINGVAAATTGSLVVEAGAVSTVIGGASTVIIGP